MKHRIVFHESGYELWAECTCRATDELGWLWLDPYLLLRGTARRAVINSDFAKHAAKSAS